MRRRLICQFGIRALSAMSRLVASAQGKGLIWWWVYNAGVCTNPQVLTFDGTQGDNVGIQGPFNFSDWTYNDPTQSSTPPMYTQAIYTSPSNTQVIRLPPK